MKTILQSMIKKIVSMKTRGKLKSMLATYGSETEPEYFVGMTMILSFLFGVSAGFFLSPLLEISFWIIFVLGVILVNAFVYSWLALVVDKKVAIIEEALPDAMQLIASNLKAGMTPDRALLLSSRPEFGPLKEEIDLVGKKVALGKNIEQALLDMANRIQSKKLIRVVELINSGLSSGGSLATLMETTASHLKSQALIDKKIKANITTYLIFIFSAAALVTPVLLALSSVLVEVLQMNLGAVELPSSSIAAIPIQTVELALSSAFLVRYLIIFIIVNCFMASLLLGLVGKGRQREGIRYYIPMLLLAILIFFLVRQGMNAILKGLFGV